MPHRPRFRRAAWAAARPDRNFCGVFWGRSYCRRVVWEAGSPQAHQRINIEQLRNRLISEAQQLSGIHFIIIDNSAAYFLGHDEVSNTQMGAHARMLRWLTMLPGGPCVVPLCHPIKHWIATSPLIEIQTS